MHKTGAINNDRMASGVKNKKLWCSASHWRVVVDDTVAVRKLERNMLPPVTDIQQVLKIFFGGGFALFQHICVYFLKKIIHSDTLIFVDLVFFRFSVIKVPCKWKI